MSFTVYVPCNCRKNNLIRYPTFKEKLTIVEGLLDIAPQYSTDIELEKEYDSWKFCEHDQIVLEFSMAQSVMGWKTYLNDNYPNRFENLKAFIPDYNCYLNTEYDKEEALREALVLKSTESEEFHERLDQFVRLLETAIELEQEIYW